MRLGEFFVRKGIITPAQLDEALRGQLIFGGHLGTCLLEMGMIDESTLGRSLGEIFGVGYAAPQLFQNIPKTVIDRLPKRLVEKHHAVPFDVRDRNLDVAMIDPRNLPALDELSFAAGTRIVPWISPEARIFQVMERYYDIPRRQRYISVCQDLDQAAPGSAAAAPRRSSGAYAAGYAPPPHVAALAMADKAEAAPSEVAHLESVPAAPPHVAADPQGRLSDALCAAEGVTEVAEAALEYAANRLTRVAFFQVRGTTASLWCARGTGQDGVSKPQLVTMPVTTDPLFSLLLDRGHYRGPLPRDPRFDAFYAALKMERGTDILIVPGYLDDRLVLLLYADGGPFGEVDADADDIRLLVAKMAIALSLLVVKKKLRTAEVSPAPVSGRVVAYEPEDAKAQAA